jgi:bis(5'-nucleosyl)-tetraphosphatase (symmetrical)
MAVYAIGDVQGCFDALRALLNTIAFRPGTDRLWFCGDLVNRGPQSAEVLRLVAQLGDGAVSVLGNHDLHMLAVAEGHGPTRRQDCFDDVLNAPDAHELLSWLRHRPLLHQDPDLKFTLVHAGLPPSWDVSTAAACAREVESAIRGQDRHGFFANMYGNEPRLWSGELTGWERLRFITNSLTRMRYCDRDGGLDLFEKGPPGTQRQGLVPWFAVPNRRSRGTRIIFGHWAALQFHEPPDPVHGVFPLDNGCAWGRRLTAMRLEDCRLFDVPCPRAGTRVRSA